MRKKYDPFAVDMTLNALNVGAGQNISHWAYIATLSVDLNKRQQSLSNH